MFKMAIRIMSGSDPTHAMPEVILFLSSSQNVILPMPLNVLRFLFLSLIVERRLLTSVIATVSDNSGDSSTIFSVKKEHAEKKTATNRMIACFTSDPESFSQYPPYPFLFSIKNVRKT